MIGLLLSTKEKRVLNLQDEAVSAIEGVIRLGRALEANPRDRGIRRAYLDAHRSVESRLTDLRHATREVLAQSTHQEAA